MRDGGTLQKYFFETQKFHIFLLQIKYLRYNSLKKLLGHLPDSCETIS